MCCSTFQIFFCFYTAEINLFSANYLLLCDYVCLKSTAILFFFQFEISEKLRS